MHLRVHGDELAKLSKDELIALLLAQVTQIKALRQTHRRA